MRIIIDPYGTNTEIASAHRVRFEFGQFSYFDVYQDPHTNKTIIVHSEGFHDRLSIAPKVANEIQISLRTDD